MTSKSTLLAVAAVCGLLAAFAVQGGEVEKKDAQGRTWTLPAGARLEGQVLTVVVPEGGSGARLAKLPLDLSDYAEAEVHLSVRATGRGVSTPKESWNGSKFMLKVKDAETGKFSFPQAKLPRGDFEGDSAFSCAFYGKKPVEATLCLGLEGASGEISFDLSTLKVEKKVGVMFPNYGYKVRYPDRIAGRPQYRGCMVHPAVTEKDLADLAGWGATMIRYQMTPTSHSYYPKGNTEAEQVADFERSLETRLAYCATNVIPAARRLGLKVAVDMHMFPEHTIYSGPKSYEAFVEGWRKVARRLKGEGDVLYGYDLMNEPVPEPEGSRWNYLTLQEECAKEIRRIDPDTPIVVSSSWGGTSSFALLDAIPLDNVIYTAHVYVPFLYALQCVMVKDHPERANRVPLPENLEQYLRDQLVPLRKFQRQHGCRIFIGEFSAVLWADRADEYIATCAKLFNEYGWDWTYHAFRESSLWSVEHEVDPNDVPPVPEARRRPSSDNPRKRALIRAFGEK